MKVPAKFGKSHRVSITGRDAEVVAITDAVLLTRLGVMEEDGYRVAQLIEPSTGDDILAVVFKDEMLVWIGYDPKKTETDQLRQLVEVFDLWIMDTRKTKH